jgi:flagellar motility protein MotE (MotC chaperone)
MRRVRIAMLIGFVIKAAVVGGWWWAGLAAARSESGTEPAAPAGMPADLFEKSRGFRDILLAVEKRGAELDQREQALGARETALKALEAALGEHVAQLDPTPAPTAAGTPGAAPGATPEPAAGPCGVVVTKVYASMKPEEAAPILDRLDDATAKLVLGCMKERQIGAILAAMNKDRAVALTKLLAGG